MKIAVFGAGGQVGRRVVAEVLSRGHEVTAVVRSSHRLDGLPATATVRIADAAHPREVAAVGAGQDAVVNATRPALGREGEVTANTHGLLAGLSQTGARLLVVGGAASLTVAGSGGRQVIDDPGFLSPALRHVGQASLEQYLICCEEAQLDWAYLSPPAELVPGERTGRYRLGGDELLLDSEGRSRISMEDLAVALVDEIETPRHRRRRFTVAY